MRRRRFLGLAGGGAAALVGGVAVDNVMLGYGTVSGTNLTEQDVGAKANERLGPVEGRTLQLDGTTVGIHDDRLDVGDDSLSWAADADDIEQVEQDHDIEFGTLVELVDDIPTLWAENHVVEPVKAKAFFDRAAKAETRSVTVEALRGPLIRDVSAEIVEEFSGVDPANPRKLAYGFVDAFREHTFYDAPRYVAGAIEDNVLRKTVELREPFDQPTDFETLLEGENSGFFCYDFVYRSLEAFHAVPAADQTIPVVGAYVRDSRHKHAYTGLATVTRENDGQLTLLLTFLDYTPTTTAHSFGVTRLIGDDPNAYTDGHRTTDMFWNKPTHI